MNTFNFLFVLYFKILVPTSVSNNGCIDEKDREDDEKGRDEEKCNGSEARARVSRMIVYEICF